MNRALVAQITGLEDQEVVVAATELKKASLISETVEGWYTCLPQLNR